MNPGSCELVIHKWSWTRHIQSERTPHILQILRSGSTALGHKSQQYLATFQCSIPLRVGSTSVATHVPGLSPPGDQVWNKEENSRWQTVQNLKNIYAAIGTLQAALLHCKYNHRSSVERLLMCCISSLPVLNKENGILRGELPKYPRKLHITKLKAPVDHSRGGRRRSNVPQ